MTEVKALKVIKLGNYFAEVVANASPKIFIESLVANFWFPAMYVRGLRNVANKLQSCKENCNVFVSKRPSPLFESPFDARMGTSDGIDNT